MSKNQPDRPAALAAGRVIGLLLVAAVVVTLSVLIYLAVAGQNQSAVQVPASPAPAPSAATPVPRPSVNIGVHFPSQGNPGHDQKDPSKMGSFKYDSDPPTSGMHFEGFSNALFDTRALPRYIQVHLLEHGNVLLQYNCTCPDVVDALQQIAQSYDFRLLPSGRLPTADDAHTIEEGGTGVILAPYPSMKSKIAVTAWTRLLTLDRVDRPKIMTFINAYLHNLPASL